MDQTQRTVYIQAQIAAMLAELEGMKVKNIARQEQGYSPAYNAEAFFTLAERFGLTHNQVITYLLQG